MRFEWKSYIFGNYGNKSESILFFFAFGLMFENIFNSLCMHILWKMIRLKLRHFYVKLIFKVNSHLGNFLQRMKSWIIGIIFICTRKLLIILSSKIQTLNYNTFIVTTQIPRAKGIECLMGNTSPKLESCSSQPQRYRANLTDSRFSFHVWYRLQHSEP